MRDRNSVTDIGDLLKGQMASTHPPRPHEASEETDNGMTRRSISKTRTKRSSFWRA
jgi:hypothetical protein